MLRRLHVRRPSSHILKVSLAEMKSDAFGHFPAPYKENKSFGGRDMFLEGDMAREGIRTSISRVGNQLDNVLERLDTTESIARIKAEVLPNSESVIWYDTERGQGSRLWSLDQAPTDDEAPEPIAQYNGLELLSIHLDEAEKIYTKRHIAENIDEAIRKGKRRRTTDVQPYFGLAKRGEYLEELRE